MGRRQKLENDLPSLGSSFEAPGAQVQQVIPAEMRCFPMRGEMAAKLERVVDTNEMKFCWINSLAFVNQRISFSCNLIHSFKCYSSSHRNTALEC